MSTADVGRQRAKLHITGPLGTAARYRCASSGDTSRTAYSAGRRFLENEVRAHVGFPAGPWSALDLSRLGRAVQKAREVLDRERRTFHLAEEQLAEVRR